MNDERESDYKASPIWIADREARDLNPWDSNRNAGASGESFSSVAAREWINEGAGPLPEVPEPTETIDFDRLFIRELTDSGSFDLRSEIWSTSFGKVIQALPIPAMLINQSHRIWAPNEACRRIAADRATIQGMAFLDFFADPAAREKAAEVLDDVFRNRKTRVMEGTLQVERNRVWARMTLRSVRLITERFVLLLVEDLTREKRLLNESKRLIASLKKAEVAVQESHRRLEDYAQSLELKVKERTQHLENAREKLEVYSMRLEDANEALKNLIAGRDQQNRTLIESVGDELKAVIIPLLHNVAAIHPDDQTIKLISAIEDRMRSVVSSLAPVIDREALLTPLQARICDMISSGLSSKEIAAVLGVTPRAIGFHRHYIRKKLGLTGSGDDLASFLRNKGVGSGVSREEKRSQDVSAQQETAEEAEQEGISAPPDLST